MLKKIAIKKKYYFLLFLGFIITEVMSQEIKYDSLFIIIDNSDQAKVSLDTLFGYDKFFHSKAIRNGSYENYYKENFKSQDSIDYSLPWKEYLFIYPWDIDKWQQEISINMNNIETCNLNFVYQIDRINCYTKKTNFGLKMDNPIILFRYMNRSPISIDAVRIKNNTDKNSFFYLSNNYKLASLEYILQNGKHIIIFVGKEHSNEKYIFYEYNYYQN